MIIVPLLYAVLANVVKGKNTLATLCHSENIAISRYVNAAECADSFLCSF